MPLPVSNILLENYDLAVWEWLGTILVDYGTEFGKGYVSSPKDLSAHPLFRIFSSAERAFSDNRIGMKSQGFFNTNDFQKIDNVPADKVNSLAPFPCVRIQNKGLSSYPERHNAAGVLRNFFSSGTQFLQRRWPVPYTLSYELEFYSRTRMSSNYLEQWVTNQFEKAGVGPYQRLLSVRVPSPYGTKDVPMTLDSIVDTSDLIADTADERTVRFVVNLSVLFLNFDLTGQDLPNNGLVRAIYRINAPTNALDGSDLDLDIWGEEGNPSLADRPVRMINAAPVQTRHTPPPYTTARLIVQRHEDSIHAAQYELNADADVVQLIGLPFLENDLVQGSIGIKWRNEDGSDPSPLIAEVLWYNVTTKATTVKQTFTIPYDATKRTSVLEFTTSPGNENIEVSVRFKRTPGSSVQRMALTHWRLWRSDIVNALESNERALGPGLQASVNRFVASGITPKRTYAFRADVTIGSQPVTFTMYADQAESVICGTKTMSSSGEVALHGWSTDDGVISVKVTTLTPDAALQINRASVSPAVPRPT